MYVQPPDSSWVTPNAAAPVPRFGTVALPAAPRAPFPDPRQTSAALSPPLPQAPPTSSSMPPPPPSAGQPPSMLARFGAPLAAVSTARSATGDGTETITVTNVVSAPAINKLGSLFNSLNKTVTGALNTFIAQQQQQPQQPGPWQPVGQQLNNNQLQLQQQQHPQQTAPTVTPVQRFPTATLPHAVPVSPATPVILPQPQPPQQPPGAPRLPSDASSAFVRVGPTADWQTRPDMQHRVPPEHHHVGPPPLARNHIQQPPPVAPHFTQSQQFTNVGDTYRELPRNHVDPRMHLAPADRGEHFQQSNVLVRRHHRSNSSIILYRHHHRRRHGLCRQCQLVQRQSMSTVLYVKLTVLLSDITLLSIFRVHTMKIRQCFCKL